MLSPSVARSRQREQIGDPAGQELFAAVEKVLSRCVAKHVNAAV